MAESASPSPSECPEEKACWLENVASWLEKRASWLEKSASWLEKRATCTADGFTYFIMFFVNPGHKFCEIRKAKFKETELEVVIDDGVDLEVLLDQAIKYREREESRTQTIDEKNKVLLTISALLLAADVAVLSNIDPKWLALFPLATIAAAVYLVLVAFRVAEVPVVDYRKICLGEGKSTGQIKRDLIKDNFDCGRKLSFSNSFRVGVHRAAWRLVPLSILLLLSVLSYGLWSGGSQDSLVKALRNNAKLRNELLGPQGVQGPPGPVGPVGSVGPVGPQGIPGPMPQDLPASKRQ